jgi:hypothetical protein
MALLFYSSLGTVGVALGPTCFLEIRCTTTLWFVLQHHQDPPQDGALVVVGDTDPYLLKLTTI